MPATQCVYGYPNGYATYAAVTSHYGYPIVPVTYQAKTTPHYATNGFCCNSGTFPPLPPPSAGYVCAVPTGQLIELEGGGYDVVDGKRQQQRGLLHNNDLYPPKNNVISNVESSDKEEGGFENWDYVYKNLESQGYSKDLGERGDILNALEMEKNRHRKLKATNLDEAMLVNNLAVSDRPLKINEALERYKESDHKTPEAKKTVNTTPSSSYENLSHTKTKNTTATKKSKATKEKTKTNNKLIEVAKKPIKTTEIDGAAVVNNNNRWQCGHCTFLNESGRDICEMCSKSKVLVEQKMEIGGAQCPKCTLVNPRECVNCQACGESLKDSPTYI